jgi:squalene-associated FAD-dependent desaturase
MSARHVGVVGAGWAGIAAAVELVRRGARVTLIEASRTAGGRARRIAYRGEPLDNGQHVLLGAYRETLALMQAVGAPASALKRLPLEIRYAGGIGLAAPRWPAPLHLALAIAFASGLTASERLAAIRLGLAVRRGESLATPGETAAALFARLGQPGRLCRLVWEPLCIAALNTPAGRADAAVFSRVLRDALLRRRSDSDFLVPAADLSAVLPEPALTWLGERGARILLGRRASALAPDDAGWTVESAEGRERFDALVCATAPHEAAGLLAAVPGLEALAARIASIAHEPITTVYLQYAGRVRLPRPMMALEGSHAQWLFDREAFGGQRGLVAAVISASHAEATLDQEVLGTKVHREIEQISGPLEAPRWTKVITEKRATFSCVPGAFRPPADTGAPGLALAGDYTEGPYPATLEGAVASGLRAARALIPERTAP